MAGAQEGHGFDQIGMTLFGGETADGEENPGIPGDSQATAQAQQFA
jgi:hypothetical protein